MLQKVQWVVLFTDINVAKVYRGRGIDRAMVRRTLEVTQSLAKEARRPLLVAVEPGCVQFKRLMISDPKKFKEKYGSMKRHWPEVEQIKARQEKFWLEMGFQKFEKPRLNTDLSNFFFWSGYFDLPTPRDIDLRDLKKPADSEAPDASMALPKHFQKRAKDDGIPRAPEHWFKNVKRVRPRDDSPSPSEEPSRKRARFDDNAEMDSGNNMDIDSGSFPQWYESSDQIGEGDLFDSINWEDYYPTEPPDES